MAKINPFRGVRPQPKMIQEVASLPYDVMNSAEARKMVENNPHSFLHVVKPEVDLPEGIDLYSEEVYQKGRENLYKMMADGVLIQDEKPCFYVYQQIMGDVNQIGIVAGASVEDYENNIIKKHEHTRAKKEADRIKHVDTLSANTGPVFLTYKARKDINEIVAKVMENKPVYDFEAEDGIKHIFWIIEENTEELINIFAEIDYLYVADGHHRSASGTKVCQRRRAENPNHTGNEEYNFFLSVIFPHDQLYIMDYNRVVKDLNNLSSGDFLKKINEKFEVTEHSKTTPFKPENLHTFGMYFDGMWYKLSAKDGTFPTNDPVNSLDVAILQNNLLTT